MWDSYKFYHNWQLLPVSHKDSLPLHEEPPEGGSSLISSRTSLWVERPQCGVVLNFIIADYCQSPHRFYLVPQVRIELTTYRLPYHYSFHYPFGLWSGLYLDLNLRFRSPPSSLYTFPVIGLGSVLAFYSFHRIWHHSHEKFPVSVLLLLKGYCSIHWTNPRLFLNCLSIYCIRILICCQLFSKRWRRDSNSWASLRDWRFRKSLH